MNITIKARLAKLEARNPATGNRPEGIFICSLTADDEEPTPVEGWGWNGGRVWRTPGETEDQLRHRAIGEARMTSKPGAIPILIAQQFGEDQK